MRLSATRVSLFSLLLALSLAMAGCGGGGGGAGSTTDAGGSTGGTAADGGSSTNGNTTEGSATVTLSWSAPTQRADGSPIAMSEIGGYRIYYGTRSGNYVSDVRIDDPYTTTYTINGLAAGSEYYLAMAAYDSQGLESSLSREINVQAQ
jgi:hypothetical protein